MNWSLSNSYLQNSFTNRIVSGLNHVLPKLPVVLFDLLVGILIIRLVAHLARFVMAVSHIQEGLRGVLVSVLETIMWLLLSVAILQELGYSGIIYFFTGSIFAIGLALSAGGSTLVADIVAGLFLARDPDFNVGDELIVGDPPVQGHVEQMDARRIRIRDKAGALHVVPNSIAERKEWVVIHQAHQRTVLAKAAHTAKRLTAAARQKRAGRRRQSSEE